MNLHRNFSPQGYARVASICYLLIILLGIFGQLVVRSSLISFGDATTTANNIAGSPLLWRMGIVGDITMHLLDIPLMVILYLLLKPVHRAIALLALAFNLIQTAVLVINKLALMVPLILLANKPFVDAFSSEQINAQILVLIDIHNYGFGLGLIFFGFACLCYGYLIFKSNYLPKFIGIFIAIAGLCYLLNSFVLIIAPALSPYIFPLLGICVIAELSLCLRLLIKGVDFQQWQQQIKKLEY